MGWGRSSRGSAFFVHGFAALDVLEQLWPPFLKVLLLENISGFAVNLCEMKRKQKKREGCCDLKKKGMKGERENKLF